MVFFKAASVLAAKNGIPFYEMQNRMGWPDFNQYYKTHPNQRTWSNAHLLDSMSSEGRKIVVDNIPHYAKIYSKGTATPLLDPGSVDYLKICKLYPRTGGLLGNIIDQGPVKATINAFNKRPFLLLITLILSVPLLCYYLFTLLALLSKTFRYSISMILVLSFILYLILPIGEFGLSRYRHPIMPMLCILAGYRLHLTILKYKPNHKKNR